MLGESYGRGRGISSVIMTSSVAWMTALNIPGIVRQSLLVSIVMCGSSFYPYPYPAPNPLPGRFLTRCCVYLVTYSNSECSSSARGAAMLSAWCGAAGGVRPETAGWSRAWVWRNARPQAAAAAERSLHQTYVTLYTCQPQIHVTHSAVSDVRGVDVSHQSIAV